jgi:hypothetical protein
MTAKEVKFPTDARDKMLRGGDMICFRQTGLV